MGLIALPTDENSTATGINTQKGHAVTTLETAAVYSYAVLSLILRKNIMVLEESQQHGANQGMLHKAGLIIFIPNP